MTDQPPAANLENTRALISDMLERIQDEHVGVALDPVALWLPEDGIFSTVLRARHAAGESLIGYEVYVRPLRGQTRVSDGELAATLVWDNMAGDHIARHLARATPGRIYWAEPILSAHQPPSTLSEVGEIPGAWVRTD
ncbi:hypothetical protein PQI66_14445 [Corynebacterium sp. USCH3]|uniref:hypothetical protein n=1 Tax=Corynebacterium sp. USCH3 TaxID=3024840 RepID=UPI0030A9939C